MRLYIGNLPFSSSSQDLRAHFEPHGNVIDAKVMTDRDTGQTRGFGFVEMDDEGGQRAIDMLDGTEFGGRRLTVNVAKAREARSAAPRWDNDKDRSGGRGGRDRYRD